MIVFLVQGALALFFLATLARWSHKRKNEQVVLKLFSFAGMAALFLPALILLFSGRGTGTESYLLFLAGLLTWKAVTKDYEWEEGCGNTVFWRLVAGFCWAASAVEGLFLLPWCAVMLFKLGIWTHHAVLGMRLVFVFVAVRLGGTLLFWIPGFTRAGEERLLVLLLIAVFVMHYWVPGLGKLKLGRHWYSWALGNTSHCLLPNAYVHGWAGFLQRQTVEKLARLIRPFDRVLQFMVLLLEAGAFLFLMSKNSFAWWLLLIVCMHTAIYLMTGLLFWENIAAAAGAISFLAPHLDRQMAWEIPFLCVAMLASKVIRPAVLAWWDSPLCGKVFFEALLKDGRRVNIPNYLLCPYERKYGQAHGLTFFDEKLPYWHLGEMKSKRLLDKVVSAGKDPGKIRDLSRENGRSRFLPESQTQGIDALRKIMMPGFFAGKRFLPDGLQWLKAPGEHRFYGSSLPALNPDKDAIKSLELVFREYLFHEGKIVALREQTVLKLDKAEA